MLGALYIYTMKQQLQKAAPEQGSETLKKIVINIQVLRDFVAVAPEVQLRTIDTLNDMPELTLSQAIKFSQKFEQLKADL